MSQPIQADPSPPRTPGFVGLRARLEQARSYVAENNPDAALRTLAEMGASIMARDVDRGRRGEVRRRCLAAAMEAVRGQALEVAGKSKEGRAAFEEAVAQFGALPESFGLSGWDRSDYGVALDATGRDATAMLREVFESGEATPEACRRFAGLLRRSGDLPGAEDVLREALEVGPRYAWVHDDLAVVLAAHGRAAEAADEHVRAGEELAAAGWLEQALATFDRAVMVDPDSAFAHTGRGEALRLLGRNEEALAAYDRASAIDPRHVPAHAGRGDVLRVTGQFDAALVSLDRALALDPANSWVLASRGSALVGLGQLERALDDLTRSLMASPREPFALYARAGVLLDLGRVREAAADLERATLIDPSLLPAWVALGTVNIELGDYEGALGTVENALRVHPGEPRLLVVRARALLGAGRLAEALTTLRGDGIDPTPDVRALTGEVLRRLDRLAEALVELDAAVAAAPKDAWAIGTRGQVLDSLGRHAEAVADLRRAVELAPEMTWAWTGLASALRDVGDVAGALEAVDRAIAADPSPAASLTKLHLLVGLERWPDALVLADEYLAARPDSVDALFARAMALNGLGRPEEALAAVNALIALDGDDIDARVSRARLLGELGRFDEAADEWIVLADRDPSVTILADLADALLNAKRHDKALDAAERALALDPDNVVAMGLRATALYFLDRDDEALAALDTVVREHPTYAYGWQLRGDLHAWHRRFDAAIESYDAALAANADRMRILVRKGRALNLANRPADAAEQLDEALRLDPAASDALAAKADSLRLLGRFAEAVEVLTGLLAGAPDDAGLLWTLGWALLGLAKWDEAVAALRRRTELMPDTGGMFTDLALGCRVADRHTMALDAAARGVELDPDAVWPLHVQAWVLLDVGRFDEALRVVDRAIALDDADSDLWSCRGWALDCLGGRPDDAIAAFTAALNRSPEETVSRKGRATVLLEMGQVEPARRDFELALKEASDRDPDADRLSLSGWCQYGLGNYEAAVDRFVSALALAPGRPDIQFDLGLTMLARGHARPAAREYEKGIAEAALKDPPRAAGLIAVARRDLERAVRIDPSLRVDVDHVLELLTANLAIPV